jgi:tRNA wybutosine-synthesizing protein 2
MAAQPGPEMRRRIWIYAPPSLTKKVKTLLEKQSCFLMSTTSAESLKIRREGEGMLIPTTVLGDSRGFLGKIGLRDEEEKGIVSAVAIEEDDTTNERCGSKRGKGAGSEGSTGPIERAVREWIEKLPAALLEEIAVAIEDLLSGVPRRWVVYTPMVLLPSGSFSSPSWMKILALERPTLLTDLWSNILQGISRDAGGTLTHLAINQGIPLKNVAVADSLGAERENIRRTPTNLHPLHGDFGPSLDPSIEPSEKDFKEAFWVSTRQNGIFQTWAPRYTMFSRGNVKEKARLLDFHSKPLVPSRQLDNTDINGRSTVDLYAGIGYFVFSYRRLGFRVLGWEINPWSVEGLRRGAVGNGWSVKIVRGRDLEKSTPELVLDGESIVIFQEDNALSRERQRVLKETGSIGRVMHVNGGLLPDCNQVWEIAFEGVDGTGWFHLHENVKAEEIDERKKSIERSFAAIAIQEGKAREVKCEHAELVKTFAPGVWHCVFDVYIYTAKVEQ